ncbi:MAG: helix-hairpin-helix domain-containing protein, partial [Erysipelotrichales bacterium]
FDPAFRTGCKLAIIDKSGKLIKIDLVFPHDNEAKLKDAKKKMISLINDYNVDVIAIGNGTASRESEKFVAQLIKDENLDIGFVIISESGASVYSASKIAQEEFGKLQVEQRSAVSIARRLLDPLSELIKIEPKSIGVGQYQHDVNQKELANKLDFTVEKIVNDIGVDLNTSSQYLLRHISGLNKGISDAIVAYREENGSIKSRKELLKVPKLGPKAFEQAAGFLKILDGNEILDRTIIHPDDYKVTYKILEDLSLTFNDFENEEYLKKINGDKVEEVLNKHDISKTKFDDIISAIKNINADKRDNLQAPILKSDVLSIEDLNVGMKLEGTVRNVVDFGAFIDIGLKNDALVHISKISKNFIKHPSEVLEVNQVVQVTVLSIDLDKKTVSLTMLD